MKNLDKDLADAVYVSSSGLGKKRKDGITKFYYFKDSSKELYYNVAEVKRPKPDGTPQVTRFLYSVTNVPK
ncbi:MAG: hypothetical protein LBR26_17780 [Prevotella sp.]|nr:hypothetical protein [Prevotella sp.]